MGMNESTWRKPDEVSLPRKSQSRCTFNGCSCLLAICRSCMFFFVITPLTGRNSPLKTSNLSLISEIVDTIG
jgi:hypothetical protein